ncbi:MAG: chromosomal replication initiator protein DnaA [Rhodospirillaceae bacterium]
MALTAALGTLSWTMMPQWGEVKSVSGLIDQASVARWEKVRSHLKREFGETAFRSWVKPLTLFSTESGTVSLKAPTRFMRDWVATHYADRIRSLWSQEDPSVRSVDVVVASAPSASPGPGPAAAMAPGKMESGPSAVPVQATAAVLDRPHPVSVDPAPSPATPVMPAAWGRTGPTLTDMTAEERDTGISALSFPLDPRFTFENFVVGKPNEFAYAAAKRVAETDSQTVSFNPLFLYGGVGLGKTHLMHAIARRVKERTPERRMLYLSAEKFMHLFVQALRRQDTLSFKEQFRSVDLLMVDDIQFISGKDNTQEEFFYTFNTLVDQGSQIVLSADKSPSDLEEIGARLRSRLASGLVADIHPTTYELRLGILESKAEQLKVDVPVKVLEFIAHKINANGREVEGALIRLVAHAQLVGRPLTLETAQDVLQDLLRSHDRRLTVEEIQKKVCEHFNIKFSEMASPRRTRSVARPRQVAMYLCKAMTSQSLPEIGRQFGGRDHTTVIHAVKKVDELIEKDRSFAEDVELLRRMMES